MIQEKYPAPPAGIQTKRKELALLGGPGLLFARSDLRTYGTNPSNGTFAVERTL